MKPLERIGVFVCHCGMNIAGTVDVKRVVAEISRYPGVVYATDYVYMCSDPGQELMRQAIREHNLSGVVNANCTPSLHEKTFRRVVAGEGLNPYRQEVANIREHCSWPHAKDKEKATQKAIAIIKTTIERLRLNITLTPKVIPMTKRALVIGGGIAGMQAALDIADAGYEVELIEKEKRLGGHVPDLSVTFPHLENPALFLQQMIKRVKINKRINIHFESQVDEISGYLGNFEVTLSKEKRTNVGAVIAATGYELLSRNIMPQYPDDPDIVDGMQFENILREGSEPINRPSDGMKVKDIIFIQCAGSRVAENGVAYCSRICCMYTVKQVAQFRQRNRDGQAFVCYSDLRSDAKNFEEFLQQVMMDEGVIYLRSEVTRVFREENKLKVWMKDTLTDQDLELQGDMIVLATAMVPRQEIRELSRKLNIAIDEYGFLTEAHIKLRPVESLTAGIYLAGTAQWPRDIPDTLVSASAAASKVLSLFSRQEVTHEPVVASVDAAICSGCGICVNLCAYKAISLDENTKVAIINEALCEGCGACAASCPSKAMQHKNWTHRQLLTMIDVATTGYEKCGA